jgi:Sec-independent protein translocase protein TatA
LVFLKPKLSVWAKLNIGSDLGSAVKGFRKGIEDEPEESDPEKLTKAENTSAESQTKEEKAAASSPTDNNV